MWILIELLACYADSSLPCRETIRDPITCKMILLIADNHASGVHMHISSAIILCHFGFHLVQLLCGENAECASLVSCSKQNMKCLRNVNVTAEFMLAGIIVLIS